jgi:hypothetical protein
VNLNGVRGALWNLSTITDGALVWTSDARGRFTEWRVYANPVYAKTSRSWPVGVYTSQGSRRLVIVSCTGKLHYVGGYGYSYDDNQFVYAAPA